MVKVVTLRYYALGLFRTLRLTMSNGLPRRTTYLLKG